MEASSVTDLLFNKLSFASEKQKIISSNIANANTPGYKTKDIVFADELERLDNNDLQLKVTNQNHMMASSTSNSINMYNIVEVEKIEEKNDGNNVSLEEQMANQAKNNVLFQALQTSIRKDAAFFKEVISASGKN